MDSSEPGPSSDEDRRLVQGACTPRTQRAEVRSRAGWRCSTFLPWLVEETESVQIGASQASSGPHPLLTHLP